MHITKAVTVEIEDNKINIIKLTSIFIVIFISIKYYVF